MNQSDFRKEWISTGAHYESIGNPGSISQVIEFDNENEKGVMLHKATGRTFNVTKWQLLTEYKKVKLKGHYL